MVEVGQEQNCSDFDVNGKCDVIDFFPLKFRLGEALRHYLRNNPDAYLTLVGDSVDGVVWSFGGEESVEAFYDATGQCYGTSGNRKAEDAEVETLLRVAGYGGCDFPSALSERLTDEAGDEGIVFFVEGGLLNATPADLSVVVRKPRVLLPEEVVCTVAKVPVQTLRVTDFYETLNIRDEEAKRQTAALDLLGDDAPTVYFVHGYAVSASGAEDWFTRGRGLVHSHLQTIVAIGHERAVLRRDLAGR